MSVPFTNDFNEIKSHFVARKIAFVNGHKSSGFDANNFVLNIEMPVLVCLVIAHLCLDSFRICIFRYDNRIGIGWWYYDNFSSNRYGNQTYILIMQNASESFLLKQDCQGHIIFADIWVPWCEDTNKDLHTYIAIIAPFARFSPLGLRVIWLFLFWFVFGSVCVCVCGGGCLVYPFTFQGTWELLPC